MDTDGTERGLGAPVAHTPVVVDPRVQEQRPLVVDAEFRVLHPWRRWRGLRDSWWVLGPYLAYCAVLWGLAALVVWLMDRGRVG